MGKSLKILLSAMNGQGHVNALLGLAGILRQNGHQLIFTLSPAWAPLIKSKNYQFEPLIYENSPNGKDGNEDDLEAAKPANTPLIDFLNQQLPILRKEPMEAIETFTSEQLVSTYLGWSTDVVTFDEPLEKSIELIKPDLIIIDIAFRLPCLIKTKIPWISLWSCSPVAIYKDACPPEGTGFSVYDPKEKWTRYRQLFFQKYKPIRDKLNAHMIKSGVDPIPDSESLYLFESPHMNIYIYPKVLDYTDIAPQPKKWYRMDAIIREPDDKSPFVIPEKLLNKPGKLIYFSLGSQGCIDVELMRRVISVLAKSPHRFIVSKGPFHEQIDLPDNCWGEKYLNQIAILPHCDLVITHGGNNTLTESLYFGKPLIVMPIFYDQLDNAQRIVDKQLGIRLNTYHFTDAQLLTAIEKLIADRDLYTKFEQISIQMKQSQTSQLIAKLIGETAIKGKTN